MYDVMLAEAILAAHLVIIAFNVAGLGVIPIGAVLRWRIVRVAWLRLLHLALLAIVAGQALAGRACILTIWQSELQGGTAAPPPLIMHVIDQLIYWNFPLWVFTVLYVAVFLYVVALVVLVPFWGPHRVDVKNLNL
ncbi:DUF2784 family protein [Acidiphilium sp.]|uniref:DUF2784 family protein n=1 Tax=Acidiphilium sp. TaxID=527 RepID=UPI003D017FD1